MLGRLDDEVGIGEMQTLERTLIRQVHDAEDASDRLAAPGIARPSDHGAAVILLGQRFQMLIHRTGEILVRRRLRLGADRLGDLDEEFRGLAVDHHDAGARQEDDGVGPEPAAG